MITATEYKNKAWQAALWIESAIDEAIRSASNGPIIVPVRRTWTGGAIEYVLSRYRLTGWVAGHVGNSIRLELR